MKNEINGQTKQKLIDTEKNFDGHQMEGDWCMSEKSETD